MDYRNCRYCMGTGKDPSERAPCQVCGGTGRIARVFNPELLCNYCNGTGKDPHKDAPCDVCRGYGFSSEEGSIEFIYIRGDMPYSDRRTIENILAEAIGEVRICETYLGSDTLDLLRSIPAACTVHVIVGKNTVVSPKLSREVNIFKKECPSFEFRHHTQQDLHDRYIVDDRGLVILGHGLKDIGKKESFAISLEKSLNPDIIRDILRAFNDRWKLATPI